MDNLTCTVATYLCEPRIVGLLFTKEAFPGVAMQSIATNNEARSFSGTIRKVHRDTVIALLNGYKLMVPHNLYALALCEVHQSPVEGRPAHAHCSMSIELADLQGCIILGKQALVFWQDGVERITVQLLPYDLFDESRNEGKNAKAVRLQAVTICLITFALLHLSILT